MCAPPSVVKVTSLTPEALTASQPNESPRNVLCFPAASKNTALENSLIPWCPAATVTVAPVGSVTVAPAAAVCAPSRATMKWLASVQSVSDFDISPPA